MFGPFQSTRWTTLSLLFACAISFADTPPEALAKVNPKPKAHTEAKATPSPSAKLLLEAHKHAGPDFLTVSNLPHSVRLIQDGSAALWARLDMIDRAKQSIDLEYFIYDHDDFGRALTQRLIMKKRANPDIKIQLLLDFYVDSGHPDITPAEVAAIRSAGIEVRYFNRTSTWLKFWLVGHRDHRKIIITDGHEVITGGRNIQTAYYDDNEEYNYQDLDIWVRGPIAASAKKVFGLTWNHKLSVKALETKDLPKKEAKDVPGFLDWLSDESFAAEYSSWVEMHGKPALDATPLHRVRRVWYASDRPGRDGDDRVVAPFIESQIAGAQTQIQMENPYFILTPEFEQEFRAAAARKVQIDLITNGARSLVNDDLRVAALSMDDQVRMVREKVMNVYNLDGRPLPGHPIYNRWEDPSAAGAVPVDNKTVWGTHAKTMVFDARRSWVSSFNLDPRSTNDNVEAGFLIDDPAVAAELREILHSHLKASLQVGTKAYTNGTKFLDNVPKEQLDKLPPKLVLSLLRWLF